MLWFFVYVICGDARPELAISVMLAEERLLLQWIIVIQKRIRKKKAIIVNNFNNDEKYIHIYRLVNTYVIQHVLKTLIYYFVRNAAHFCINNEYNILSHISCATLNFVLCLKSQCKIVSLCLYEKYIKKIYVY